MQYISVVLIGGKQGFGLQRKRLIQIMILAVHRTDLLVHRRQFGPGLGQIYGIYPAGLFVFAID